MPVRNRRVLYSPNAFRRSMAYPHGDGRHIIPGFSLATFVPALLRGYIADVAADRVLLEFNGTVSSSDPVCGWTYSVNGGADTAFIGYVPGGVLGDNVYRMIMVAPVVFGDVVTVSYVKAACDLAVKTKALDDITDFAVESQVTAAVTHLGVPVTYLSEPVIYSGA